MSTKTPHRAALAAGLILAHSYSAFAQQPAQAAGGDAAASGLSIVLTPSRGPQEIQRSGSAVTVIRSEEIEKAGLKSSADLFRSVPGAFVVEDGGPGQSARIRLRGSEVSHTLVLIDGVRVNDPSNTDGHFDFANLVPTDIERIEVLRGPQSALYGSDAIGGVINIITHKGRGGYRGFAELEGGSYGTLAGRTGVSGGTKEFDYSIALSGAQSDGFSAYGYRIPRITRMLTKPLDDDGYKRWGGMARFAWRPVEGVEIETGVTHSYSRAKFDYSTGDAPNIGFGATTSAFLRANLDMLDGRLRNSLALTGMAVDRDYKYRDAFFPSWAKFGGERLGISYQGDLKLDQFGKLTFGGQIEQERYRSSGTYSTRFHTDRVTRSAFLLHQLPIGERFDLSLGGRVDDVERADRFVTWRATGAYRIPEWGTKLRASVGTGAKAPALDQLFNPSYGNPNLNSERSTGYDAGIDQSLFGGRANVSVTAFANRYRDLIQYSSGGCLPTQFFGCYFNVGRAETKGIEAAGDAVIIENTLTAKGSYTFMTSEDKATHLSLVRRPQHSGTVSVKWMVTDKISFEPTLRLVGARFDRASDPVTFAAIRPKLAPYARLDIRADYQVHKNLNVYLRAENLTNARYQEVYNYGTTGRAIYAGARATW